MPNSGALFGAQVATGKGLELRIIPADGSKTRALTAFIDYDIDHELMTADGAFAINIVPDAGETMPIIGDVAELYVNQQRVLCGWIESIVRKIDKQGGRGYAVYGRSKSAILVDNAILPDNDMWNKHENVTLAGMFKKLLAQFPEDHRPRMGDIPAEGADLTVEIAPGDTYWEVMTRIATARGVYLVCLSDGSLALSTLNKSEIKEAQFGIELGTPGANALEGNVSYDMTKRYANIIVISQNTTPEGTSETAGTVINDSGAIFPRTIVVNPEQDGQNIEEYGKLYRAKQIKDSMQFEYTVEGHEQGGNVWAVGAGCAVKDVINGIDMLLLINGITYTLSKQDGRRTVIRLCPYFED